MLDDLSASIKALLEYELKTPGEEVIPDLSISFDQPDEEFPPASVTKPAANLFLYDIREDLKLRHNERFFNEFDPPTSSTISREPLLIECSYLVTAWSDSEVTAAHDEHYVIATIIKALRRYNCLPETLPNKIDPNGAPVQILQGSLQGVRPYPRAFTIQESYFQGLGEFWRSMGHEPKPKFNYSVTIAVDVHANSERSLINTVELSLSESAVPKAEADEATLQLLVPDDEAQLSADTEFLVNTYTTFQQNNASVIGLVDGCFVVVWDSMDLIGVSGITARRYDKDGSALGDEFSVSPPTVYAQYKPSVAALRWGGFVITWENLDSTTGDTDGAGISARLYDSNGDALGDEFLINTHTVSNQASASVTGLADGGFVIAWGSLDPAIGDTESLGIAARRFDAEGNAVDDEFLVNTNTALSQSVPSVAALSSGGFAVVWESLDSTTGDTDSTGISARLYDSDGDALGNEFLVNTYTVLNQNEPAISALMDGGFVVTWRSQDPATGDDDVSSIVAQRFNATGDVIGSEFLVNTHTGLSQEMPTIASLADGGFVVVWKSDDPSTGDSEYSGIVAQRYDVAGDVMGSEFLVNTHTASFQRLPAVSALMDGGLVVAWSSTDPATGDTDDDGITARRFRFVDTLIVDVLANDSDPDADDILTLDVATLTGDLGRVWIANNKLVFYAGTDFDYLDEGQSTMITIDYQMSDAGGRTSCSSVEVTVIGRQHMEFFQLL